MANGLGALLLGAVNELNAKRQRQQQIQQQLAPIMLQSKLSQVKQQIEEQHRQEKVRKGMEQFQKFQQDLQQQQQEQAQQQAQQQPDQVQSQFVTKQSGSLNQQTGAFTQTSQDVLRPRADASNILSQLELQNIVRNLRGQQGGGQPGQIPGQAQPQGVPQAPQQPLQPQRQPQPQNVPQASMSLPGGGVGDVSGQQIPGGPSKQQAPPPFIQVQVKGRGKFGETTTKTVLKDNPDRKLFDKQREEKLKLQVKRGAGQRASEQSLLLVSGSFRELAQTYADAVREGGVGNLGSALLAKGRLKLGGRQAEGLSETSALPGLVTEVIGRMMPILTQQGEKPGSVRLVETIFKRLTLTVPQDNTPPKNARSMMEKTLRNMYRFDRASRTLGINNESVEGLNPSQLNQLSSRVANLARTINITGEESKQLKSLISESLRPIDELIQTRDITPTNRIKNKYGLE